MLEFIILVESLIKIISFNDFDDWIKIEKQNIDFNIQLDLFFLNFNKKKSLNVKVYLTKIWWVLNTIK
jgi:hypothetical protein